MLEKVQADEDFVSITDSILQHEDANVERDGKIYAKPGIYIMGSVVLEVDETGIPKRLNQEVTHGIKGYLCTSFQVFRK